MSTTIKINESNKKKQKMLFLLIVPICIILVIYMGIHSAMLGGEGDENKEVQKVDRMIVEGDTSNSSIDDKLKLYEQKEARDEINKKAEEEKQSSLNDMFATNEVPLDVDTSMNKPLTAENPIVKQENAKNTNVMAKVTTKKKSIKTEKPIEEKRSFYSSSSSSNSKDVNDYAYKEFYNAYVDRDEVLRSGQTLHMRFSESAYINGVTIPKGTLFTGIVSLSSERANIKVSNIKLPEMILPTKIVVFDIEGNEGIYSPGGFNQEAGNEAANDGTNINVNIPVVGSVSKKVASKKINDQTCKFSKNYKILIKDFSDNN